MGSEVERLATLVASRSAEDLPAPVLARARLTLLDTFGVILAGSEMPNVRALRATTMTTAGSGATLYARGLGQTDPGRAALLNGIAGRSIELCEGHVDIPCQAAVQAVPAILATAESTGASGREMLAALALGYEVAVRIGAAFTRRPLTHPTGQAGMLGAIAATARLHRLDAAGTSLALRIGANLMLLPSYTNVVAGATALNCVGGMSGLTATLAPQLALAGFEAQSDAIEHALGRMVGAGFEPSAVLPGLGEDWAILHNHFRLRACCNPIYPALDALGDALAALAPAPEDIERVEVATYDFAAVMNNQRPTNAFGCRYSLPHAAAALICGHGLGHTAFLDDVVHDPRIAALRLRVNLGEDPQMNAGLPAKKPARVRLVLKDGREVTCARDNPSHDSEDAHTEPNVRAKFRELASAVVRPEGAADVEETLDRIEQWPDVEPLRDVLRRHLRT